ncbi:MAG: hypothetical protein HOP19_24170 [Acidobacteria bacterium]|nr:hypothetical protein [Acidobacteriota bacterium]
MKLIRFAKVFVLSAVLLGVALWRWPAVNARLSGPPLSNTGAPVRGTFPAETNCTSCHNGGLNSDDGTVAVAVTPAFYSPNQEVQITISAEQLERHKFGFQGTALDELGRPAGQWIVTDRERTQVVTETAGAWAGRSYIQHTFQGAEPTGLSITTWALRWKAPLANVCRITFYFAVNAGNNDGRDVGDSIYTRTVTLAPAATLPAVVAVSSASYFLSAPLAPDSMASLFGVNMTNVTAAGASVPLPTTLAEAQVRIRDAAGVERDAPLFFVSPGQINFLVPPKTGLGNATINLRLQNSTIATGTVAIARTAPGLFAANADGSGVAAALLLRFKPNGAQIYEPLARYNEMTRKFEALPIDLGPAEDQLFLTLFGTGFKAALVSTCTIGGQNAEVIYAGPQGLTGLDQANVRLAHSFAGRGNLNVVLRVDNQNANPVTINVK